MQTAHSIRFAAVTDASEIARIHVETWRSAYRDFLPADFLASLSIEKRTAGWEKSLQEKRDRVLVAQISGSIRGWISFGRYRDTTEEHASEIFALYVETSARDSCDEEQTAQEELEWCCRELTWTRNVS